MAKGMSGGKAGYGKQQGGGTRYPKASFSVLSSSSRKVEGVPGKMRVGTFPSVGRSGGK